MGRFRNLTLLGVGCAAFVAAVSGCGPVRQPYEEWTRPVGFVEEYCEGHYRRVKRKRENPPVWAIGELSAGRDRFGAQMEYAWWDASTFTKLGHFAVRRKRDGPWPAFEIINYDDCAESRKILEGLIEELERRRWDYAYVESIAYGNANDPHLRNETGFTDLRFPLETRSKGMPPRLWEKLHRNFRSKVFPRD